MRAFLFGVTVAAAIGPMALLIIHLGFSLGLRRALGAAAGVACADLFYSVLAFSVGAELIVRLQSEERIFRLAASLLLLVVGLRLAAKALRHSGTDTPDRPPAPLFQSWFCTTFFLTLGNPLTVSLFVGFSGQVAYSSGWKDILFYSGMIFLGSLPVQGGFALLGSSLRRAVLSPGIVRGVNLLSTGGISAFGLFGILTTLLL